MTDGNILLRKIKKLLLLTIIVTNFSQISASSHNTSEKIYIDTDEFNCKDDTFRIHIGHNIWLETNTVHRDSTGLYTFESNLIRSMQGSKAEYQKTWKCPYCYQYWPIKVACQNQDCPSKYK